jgi:hypothetical protein
MGFVSRQFLNGPRRMWNEVRGRRESVIILCLETLFCLPVVPLFHRRKGKDKEPHSGFVYLY